MRLPRRLADGARAELVDHLGELRARLFVCVGTIAAAFAVTYGFHGRLLDWLNEPLPDPHRKPVTLGVAEPFTTALKVSLAAAVALALPVILWQAWSFLAPALDPRVRRTIAGFTAAAGALLAAGIAFGYVIALPAALHFLTSYDTGHYDIEVRASSYYSFALLVLVAVGVVFQLPIFVVALVRLGITSSARLRRNRRLGYVIVAAVAVALPGVDPATTAVELLPLLVLFEASIWISAAFERRWRRDPEPHAARA
jgi:sec-independent protein translocase protein TatC